MAGRRKYLRSGANGHAGIPEVLIHETASQARAEGHTERVVNIHPEFVRDRVRG